MAAVIAFVVRRRPRAGLIGVGAIAAALLFTKINVGGYAIISIGFAAIMAGPTLLRHAVLRRLAIVAFVLVGPVVMISKLKTSWARSYEMLALISTLSLVFVALPVRIEATRPISDESGRWPQWLLGGFAASAWSAFWRSSLRWGPLLAR